MSGVGGVRGEGVVRGSVRIGVDEFDCVNEFERNECGVFGSWIWCVVYVRGGGLCGCVIVRRRTRVDDDERRREDVFGGDLFGVCFV